MKRHPASQGWQSTLGQIEFSTNGLGRIAVVGKSGVGKSTLFNLISGIDEEAEGLRVQIEGTDGFGLPLTSVTQERDLLDWLTVAENVEFGASGDSDALERLDWTLEQLGLVDLADRYPNNLSGGERARVAIARALIADPGVVLLDEPFTGLDEPARWAILDDLLTLQSKRGFLGVLVTHDLEEAIAFSERVYILAGRPATLREAASVTNELPMDRTSDVFLSMVDRLRRELEG